MMEEEYQLEYFRTEGLVRKICTACGAAFWTRDPEREICGDAPCSPYQFIGNPIFRSHTVDEMREAYLSFFEQHGHARVDRYPVAARWRDDIYLTIASIADFQPYVTSGTVPPPANPLTISQPCIRLNDLDSVGRSGRHLTTFEMMAHHAFNSEHNEIYWKDQTVGLCDKFLESIGADMFDVTYKEHPWIGGGNAGPSVEVLTGGLEVATLVFMSLGKTKNDKEAILLEGTPYYPIDLQIVDTGYGLERFVWASQGSPTIYDAVFPEMVSHVMDLAGLGDRLDDREFITILGQNAKFAGLMDISGQKIFELRQEVARQIGIPVDKLDKMIRPVESVYATVDHTRCLAYMLGDCIVPSNAKDGYLARLVLRRTLRMLAELGINANELGNLVMMQMEAIGTDSFEQSSDIVSAIIDREIEKYETTMERGTRTVQRIAKGYKAKSEKIPLEEIITLYDSHGLPPDMVKDLANAEGAVVDLPDDFYSQIANMHSENQKAPETDPLDAYFERISVLPATECVYYELPTTFSFKATVLDCFDGNVILDQTLFYPDGGGQPGDTGILVSPCGTQYTVQDTIKSGNVIVHVLANDVQYELQPGDIVQGVVDEERRRSLMRHHTATHILLRAAQKVLGAHIHQSGAQKGEKSSRLDIRHYMHITDDEIAQIELEANRLIMENSPSSVSWEERTTAEQKYGFSLYQGGVPPGAQIRVVQVAGDIEACAGTHCERTGDIGFITVIRIEHVQDGVERIEFAAGAAAVEHVQGLRGIVREATDAFSVQTDVLPEAARRFFSEWKDQRKEIERLSRHVSELEIEHLVPEQIGQVSAVIRQIDLSPSELAKIATTVTEKGGVAVLISKGDSAHVVVASRVDQVKAGDLVHEVAKVLGGKGGGKPTLAQGGGPDIGSIDLALERARDILRNH